MPRLRSTVLFLVIIFGVFRGAAGDTLVYSHFSNVGPLNPHMYSPNQMFGQEMVYEPLVQLSADGVIEPCLAESWDISEDGKTYIFHLRPGVRFSDGTLFDAKAVELNFTHIMANRQRHAWLDIANRIESFAATGDLTFQLVLDSPYYPTLEDLSLPRPFRFLSPAAFPAAGITRDSIKAPVGTGPWVLAESSLGVRDLFRRNEDYWGERPGIAQIEIKVIPDPISRAMALQTGEIDLIYGLGQVTFDAFNALRNDQSYETAVSQPVGGLVLALNSNRGPTRDLAVRRALQHLTDKDALIRGIFLGTQPRADTLFAASLPYCDVGLIPYQHDPALARRLLEEAGWLFRPGETVRSRDGEQLRIDLCFIGNDAAHKALAEVLQGQAAKVGIFLNLVGEEEDSFLRRQRDGAFGMIVNPTWGPPFEPHAFLGSMRKPSHADYQAQIGLPMKARLDSDITAALATVDPGERQALIARVLTTLHEQAVYLPINYITLLAVYKTGNIGGFRFGPGKSKYPFEHYLLPKKK